LSWGKFTFDDNLWVLQTVDQSFTLFRFDGLPLRATLNCTFRQWRGSEVEKRLIKTSSPDVAKSRVVQRGETLSSIAAEEYKDPALWRPIAEANGIDNPRRLEPGRALAIPALRPGRGERG
jgi:nucleoid-associated protein YgaU